MALTTSAAPHCFYSHVHAAPGCHHDNRQRAVHGLHPCEQVEPFLSRRRIPRVIEINQREIEIFCELFTRPVVMAALKKFVENTGPMPHQP